MAGFSFFFIKPARHHRQAKHGNGEVWNGALLNVLCVCKTDGAVNGVAWCARVACGALPYGRACVCGRRGECAAGRPDPARPKPQRGGRAARPGRSPRWALLLPAAARGDELLGRLAAEVGDRLVRAQLARHVLAELDVACQGRWHIFSPAARWNMASPTGRACVKTARLLAEPVRAVQRGLTGRVSHVRIAAVAVEKLHHPLRAVLRRDDDDNDETTAESDPRNAQCGDNNARRARAEGAAVVSPRRRSPHRVPARFVTPSWMKRNARVRAFARARARYDSDGRRGDARARVRADGDADSGAPGFAVLLDGRAHLRGDHHGSVRVAVGRERVDEEAVLQRHNRAQLLDD